MHLNFRKIILLMQIGLLLPTLTIFYDFCIHFDYSVFVFLSLLYVFSYGLILPVCIIIRLQEKYGEFEALKIISTYKFRGRSILFWMLALFYLIFVGSYDFGYFSKGFLCSVFFIIPILSLLLGVNVFDDSSCIVDDEIVLGYPPTLYPILSLILGIFGFSFILNSQVNSTIILVITFVFQLVIVLPHVFNKFVPFEIRTKKGCLYFLVSSILCYAVLIFLVIGGDMFSSSDTFVNPGRILENVLFYGGGMVLVMLFYRQFKKMNEKKK